MAKKPRVTSEELSTKLNTRVKVFEDGKVQLLKRKSTSDAEEDGTDEESDFYSILDKRQKGGKMQSRPKKIKTK